MRSADDIESRIFRDKLAPESSSSGASRQTARNSSIRAIGDWETVSINSGRFGG